MLKSVGPFYPWKVSCFFRIIATTNSGNSGHVHCVLITARPFTECTDPQDLGLSLFLQTKKLKLRKQEICPEPKNQHVGELRFHPKYCLESAVLITMIDIFQRI